MYIPTPGSQPRLFLALWPDDTIRKRIVTRMARYSDLNAKWVKPDNIHLTLAFLGNVQAERVAKMIHVLSSLQFESFNLNVDYIYYVHRSRMLWLTASKPSTSLLTLVNSISQGLEECGFAREKRPFSAHVTLARKVPIKVSCQPTSIIEWPISSYCLVESDTTQDSPVYHIRETWRSKR